MRVIIIGEDKLAYFLGKHFVAKHYNLTVITPQSDQALVISHKLQATVLFGDGSEPKVLEDADAYRADVLLALTAQDENNLVACQVAQKRFGVPRTIALVNDPANQVVFRQLGVTVAFSATEILGHLIEQQTDYKDIKALIPVAGGDVQVAEITLKPSSPAVGKSLKHLDLQDTNIACIVRQGTVIIPKGWSYLQAADRLIVISKAGSHGAAYQAIMGDVN